MNILKVENLTKRFRKHTIFENINVEFKEGQIYGLVGENGSGKTVLMKTLVGLIHASSGRVIYNNQVLKKDFDFLPSVGIIIEEPGFFMDMTGFENLKLLSQIRSQIGEDRIYECLELVGLNKVDKKVGNYSMGMRQRLGLSQAIMENPDVLILDEFTNGLDEKGIDMAHAIIRSEKEKGKIIIISSHSKYDIESLCDHIYAFREGVFQNEK